MSGRFDWAAPDEEVHAFVNDLEWPIDTYLYGWRMSETMISWETAGLVDGHAEVIRDCVRSGVPRTRSCTGARFVALKLGWASPVFAHGVG